MTSTAEVGNIGTGRPTTDLALGLADLHLAHSPGDVVHIRLDPVGDAGWTLERADDVLVGAGFVPDTVSWCDDGRVEVVATRIRSLPDTVAPGLRLLVVGLNPSPSSADTAVGFHRAGNRFWPAVLEAGLASIDREPRSALHDHGLGMTDLFAGPPLAPTRCPPTSTDGEPNGSGAWWSGSARGPCASSAWGDGGPSSTATPSPACRNDASGADPST